MMNYIENNDVFLYTMTAIYCLLLLIIYSIILFTETFIKKIHRINANDFFCYIHTYLHLGLEGGIKFSIFTDLLLSSHQSMPEYTRTYMQEVSDMEIHLIYMFYILPDSQHVERKHIFSSNIYKREI